jgi:hypothetical protein
MPEGLSELRYQVDHVIAEKHGGPLLAGNLAWACFRCNSHKGPNLSGWDEKSGVIRLFNPRSDLWAKHFRWAGARLVGKTMVGRATVRVLCINRPETVELRESWIREGISL